MQSATTPDFANETSELHHCETDRSEVHDRAAGQPDKVKELVNPWYVEARKYDVLGAG